MQESPRKADSLPLAAGECISQLSHICLVAVGKRHDPVMQGSLPAGLFDLLLRRIQPGDPYVVGDRILEHLCILRHIALHVAQVGRIDLPDINDLAPRRAGAGFFHNSDPALLYIPEAHQKLEERGLSAAALSHYADDLVFMDAE